MTYWKPIKNLLHKYWRGESHIGRWYYKQWYMKKIGKPLNLACYRKYIQKKRRRNKRHQIKLYGHGILHLSGFKRKLLRESNHCWLCGKYFNDGGEISVDHVKPKSKYPELVYDITNMRLAHSKCNSERPI